MRDLFSSKRPSGADIGNEPRQFSVSARTHCGVPLQSFTPCQYLPQRRGLSSLPMASEKSAELTLKLHWSQRAPTPCLWPEPDQREKYLAHRR